MTPAESGRQVRVLVIPWPEQPTKIPAMPSWLIWLLRIVNWVELLTQTPYLPLPVLIFPPTRAPLVAFAYIATDPLPGNRSPWTLLPVTPARATPMSVLLRIVRFCSSAPEPRAAGERYWSAARHQKGTKASPE